jgi:flagellar biosynthesis GTPase FlhF
MHKRRVDGPNGGHSMGHHGGGFFSNNPPPMNMTFTSMPSFTQSPYCPPSQPNFEAIAAQRQQAQMDAVRLQQLEAEAQANEQRRNLERLRAEERHREELARIHAQEDAQRLEWARGAPARAEQRRLEEAVREERERQQRIEEAQLAEARRIQAEKHAEEHKIQALREAEETRTKEEQIEQQRQLVFDAHHQLISTASDLEFIPLQHQINALEPLTQPIARFKYTAKKGMPMEAEHHTGLFFSILQNKKFGNDLKYQLLECLITSKGYSEYMNLLLSSPILELLVAEAVPKMATVDGVTVIIPPEQPVILQKVFQQAVACKMLINPSVEQRIYPALITAGYGMDVFNYHVEQKTAAETMRFLSSWRVFNDIAHSHANLFDTHKEMSDDLYKLLKADYLSFFSNDYASFVPLVIAAEMNDARISALLDEWRSRVSGYDVRAFMNEYAYILTLPKEKRSALKKSSALNESYVIKILMMDEEFVLGEELYGRLKSNNVSSAALTWLLNCWLDAFKKLIAANTNKTKLMRYVDAWMDVLPDDDAIRGAYCEIKGLIQNTSLNDFRFSIRKIGAMNTVKLLVVDKQTIKNEEATVKWLNRHSLFCRNSESTSSFSQSYTAVRNNVETGKSVYRHELEQAEAEINQKLKAVGEEGHFAFRQSPA